MGGMGLKEMDKGGSETGPFTRIVFGGDREIAVKMLRYLRAQGVTPAGLMLPSPEKASHWKELESLCPELPCDLIWRGEAFRAASAVEKMASMNLDYIVCIHFPLLMPKKVLAIPRFGVLNLHPALLPFNRGWHTPSWAILDGTPCGATLHFMAEEVDSGDIVLQKSLEVRSGDTANTLYRRILELEAIVFKEAWPALAAGSFPRTPQPNGRGSSHRKNDLFRPDVQEIDLNALVRVGDLIDKLRALTTNRQEEAAYFCQGNQRYRVQVRITEEP